MACGQVCQCTGSLQLRVLRLGLLQDGDVGVGVFPGEARGCPELDGEVFWACSGSQGTLVLDAHLAFDFGEAGIGT
jgi:hypothetical protein